MNRCYKDISQRKSNISSSSICIKIFGLQKQQKVLLSSKIAYSCLGIPTGKMAKLTDKLLFGSSSPVMKT